MKTLEERFWSKVDKSSPTGCWLWASRVGKNGYAYIGDNYKTLLAHRISYESAKGAIPEGYDVCHTCDVRSCVNPDHLFVGTRKDNMQDCKNKGRGSCGEKNGHAKLTADDIRSIRSIAESGVIYISISRTCWASIFQLFAMLSTKKGGLTYESAKNHSYSRYACTFRG